MKKILTYAFVALWFLLSFKVFADIYPEPEKCRDEAALYAQPALAKECLPVMFLKPESQENQILKNFQEKYFQQHGHYLHSNALLNGFLGFFIDAKEKVFISAIHPYEDCVAHSIGGSWNGEYLVSENNPPINCGDIELLFIGKDLMTTNSMLDPYLNLDLVKKKKRIGGCFDCVPISEVTDIVVGRVLSDFVMPKNPISIELLDTMPSKDEATILLGVPEILREPRISLGSMQDHKGSAVVVSNFALPGFSGGPILNSSGKAFGVAVTKISHSDRIKKTYGRFEHPSGILDLWKEMGISIAYPNEWQPSWTVAVSLAKFKEQIQVAMKYVATK